MDDNIISLIFLNIDYLILMISIILFFFYQPVPKSQKYFSLPAGQNLDSHFPFNRRSRAGNVTNQGSDLLPYLSSVLTMRYDFKKQIIFTR